MSLNRRLKSNEVKTILDLFFHHDAVNKSRRRRSIASSRNIEDAVVGLIICSILECKGRIVGGHELAVVAAEIRARVGVGVDSDRVDLIERAPDVDVVPVDGRRSVIRNTVQGRRIDGDWLLELRGVAQPSVADLVVLVQSEQIVADQHRIRSVNGRSGRDGLGAVGVCDLRDGGLDTFLGDSRIELEDERQRVCWRSWL